MKIELVTRGEQTLKATLLSITSQKYTDYEIVCVNSSNDPTISDLIKESGAFEVRVPLGTRALEARYMADRGNRSNFALILDSTRPLCPNALQTLMEKYSSHDLICIRERSIPGGFWSRQAGYLREYSESKFALAASRVDAYILPRLYKGEILEEALTSLHTLLNAQLFSEISYGEHHLIFEMVNKVTQDIVMTKEMLIEHFEDQSLSSIWKKYHWYGSSQQTLRKLPFRSRSQQLISHKRGLGGDMRLRIKSLPLRTLRVLAFLSGYCINNGKTYS